MGMFPSVLPRPRAVLPPARFIAGEAEAQTGGAPTWGPAELVLGPGLGAPCGHLLVCSPQT